MDLATLGALMQGIGGAGQIALLWVLWRLDRRVYKLEIKVGVA